MSYKSDLAAARRAVLSAPHDFALLGVNRKSTARDIQEARNALARTLHPDRLTAHGMPEGDDLMGRINAAADRLSDAKRVKLYLAELATGRCKCPTCQGEGVTRKQKSMTNIVYLTCPTCHGAGLA